MDALLLGVSGKLVSLKRKAEEAVKEEVECVQACKTRLEHLKAYASGELGIYLSPPPHPRGFGLSLKFSEICLFWEVILTSHNLS